MSLNDAKKKIVYADYLLSRESSDNFVTGATNHIISAAQLAIMEYLQISKEDLENKDLVIKTFNKLNSKHSNFYNFYSIKRVSRDVRTALVVHSRPHS